MLLGFYDFYLRVAFFNNKKPNSSVAVTLTFIYNKNKSNSMVNTLLTEKEVTEIRTALSSYKNPLFIFDDDPDGLCSFLLLYRMHREGRGVILKTSSTLDTDFIRLIKNYTFDAIFILDIPKVTQAFVDNFKCPIYWIDHHEVLQLDKVKYYNPHTRDPSVYIPATWLCHQIADNEKDLWLAMVGCLADWAMPDFREEFVEKYSDLMSSDADLDKAVFQEDVGTLVRVFAFLLKGPSSKVRKNVKILTRIKSPYDILKQETPSGKFLYKHFSTIDENYQKVLKAGKDERSRSKLLVFEYGDNKWSFTAILANELASNNRDKVVIIARKSEGKVKASIRARTNIADPLKKTFEQVNGSGGGHPNACGAVVPEEDWEDFLKIFDKEIKKKGRKEKVKIKNKLKKPKTKKC
jgi:single-stranded DNA-specific DHH superfamily exonuclease